MKQPLLRRFRLPIIPLLALSLAVCAGCAVYGVLAGESDRLLAEPLSRPAAPDISKEFKAYRNIPVAVNPEPFAETARATDMGYTGVPLCVGLYPLRAIAGRGLHAMVERHFRAPVAGERPAVAFETIPKMLSVQKDGRKARVHFSVDIRCIKQDEAQTVLFANTYTGMRTGSWFEGTVPGAVYEALDDIWLALLKDFLGKVPPGGLADRPQKKTGTPLLGDLTFTSEAGPYGSAHIVGCCSVACNGAEASETAEWAHRRILALCAGHLGVAEDHVGIRYNDEKTRYDKSSETWTFAFFTWARTRMSLQYDPIRLKGRAVVDLGLFEGTAEEAALAAKEYIARELNLRAGIYATDAPDAVADIRFGEIVTDVERGELVLPFTLVY